MHEQCPQIGVTAPANAEQVRLAAAGVLSGYQPEPRSELTAAAEYSSIANASNQGARGKGTNAGNLGEPSARLVALVPALDLRLKHLGLLVQVTRVVQQLLQELPQVAGQRVLSICEDTADPRPEILRALRNDDAELSQEAANLVGLCHAP